MGKKPWPRNIVTNLYKGRQKGIMCLSCKEKLFSYNRHDFKYCKCHKVFVDGGYDYLRYGFPFGPRCVVKVKVIERIIKET